jgi:hypothetical protein
MTRHRRRPTPLSVCALEVRLLLDGTPTGTWLGQDGHDLAGPSSVLAPDGVQDIHIALANLPASLTITSAKIQPLGGGEWDYNGPFGPWAAALVRSAGATTADLFMDPYQFETGRPFAIVLTYNNGTTASLWVQGGSADPNLRMPNVALQVAWVGQDGHDFVGPGPDVGPDGIQDVHLVLSNLSAGVAVSSGTIDGPNGESWGIGLNPEALNNAELVPNANDATKADLYLSPAGNMQGQSLTVAIVYANGKTDSSKVVAGASNPGLLMPAPPTLPVLRSGPSAAWLGQDGQGPGSGDVHATLASLPAGLSVIAAELTDAVGGTWIEQTSAARTFYGDPYALPLTLNRTSADAPTADLFFPPIRSETGSALTLRLIFSDGSNAVASLAGGSADSGLRSANIAATSVVAHPGDDLSALTNAYGTVHLTAGEYDLGRPLVLNNPVTIAAEPGTTLVFTQSPSDPAWAAAIKIESGHTTLDGFSVRFAGPVRWDWTVDYGPAVIGSTDNQDLNHPDPKAALTLSHLDLQSPAPASTWEQAPMLIRLATAHDGQIVNNTLKGGTTVVLNGPWLIAHNDYEGTVPGTYAASAFAGHNTHDLVLENNQAELVGPSGKTWRFLVLTISGTDDVIQNNSVIGIGPMDSDTVPSANAPEIILTEAYSLHFEGMPAAVTRDGRIVQVPALQGNPARAGDVVAVLSGPQAGTWRRIAQAIDAETYLLADPLPAGSYAISIATGFVDETFQGNAVDSRGSSTADDLVLAGDHFGAKVLGNQFLGGAEAFAIEAAPTEQPDFWGWSHAPFLGGTIDGNTIADAGQGGVISVDHSAAVKSNSGRVYFSGSLTNTTVAWSAAFLAAHPHPVGLTVGDPGSIDPGELVVAMSGNHAQATSGNAPSNTLVVHSATVNGTALVDQSFSLPQGGSSASLSAPDGLRLVHDTGLSPYDDITNDAHLKFDPLTGAAGYAYRVGDAGSYTSIGAATAFLPAGLAQGVNDVFVHALDATGDAGPDTEITIQYLTTPPEESPPVLDPSSDTGHSSTGLFTSVTMPTFDFTASYNDTVTLLRNGVAMAQVVGPGSLTDPGVPGPGTYAYAIERSDYVGNVSVSPPTVITILTSPPPAPGGLAVLANGEVQFEAVSPLDLYEYRVGASATYFPLWTSTTFAPQGLVQGPNQVFVRAVDLAGNAGPAAELVVTAGGATPSLGTPSSPVLPAAPSEPAATPVRSHAAGSRHPRARPPRHGHAGRVRIVKQSWGHRPLRKQP